MKIEPVVPELVVVGARHRGADQKKVEALAESISALGLLQPITVYTPDDSTVELVAGLHRLEAFKLLGLDEIPAIFITGSDIDRELAEIDENLCRAELTATQEAEHLARRKDLWEAREARKIQVGKVCPPESGYKKPPAQKEGFAANTAKATGKSKRGINQAIQRANEITSEARDLIRNTKLDTGAFLDRLIGVDEGEQVEYARRALEALSDKERRAALKQEAEERERDAKEARKRAKIAACDFLLDALNARQWDKLIILIEQAGGSISAQELRKWQAPAEAA